MHSIKNGSKNLQEMYADVDLKDSLGKEELYLRKITMFYVWDYYYSNNIYYNYEIMLIQLYWIIKTNYICKYTFYDKTRSNINSQDVWTCWS